MRLVIDTHILKRRAKRLPQKVRRYVTQQESDAAYEFGVEHGSERKFLFWRFVSTFFRKEYK